MDDKTVTPVKTVEEIRKGLAALTTSYDSNEVARRADKEIREQKDGNWTGGPETTVFKAMTLNEFENGPLLITALAEQFRTFAIDLLRKLQTEYRCQTPSECALAELASLNFVRTLDVQQKMTSYFNKGSFSADGVKYLNLLSVELDRANRHFLTTINSLKMMHQPTFNFNLNTQTAVIGQNQVVQAGS